MLPRKRFIIVLVIVVLAAAFCSSRVYSQDRAKPRGQGGSQAQPEGKSSGRQPEARQPRAGRSQPQGDRSEARDQGRARRDDAEARRPRPGTDNRRDSDNERRGRESYRTPDRRSDAERRHPQADGRYNRDWDRYNWRNYSRRDRWSRDRFPRYYPGLRLFGGFLYMGRPFGPHYGLWYRDRFSWRLFYWPYSYAPAYGCGWYLVPRERTLVYDPYSGEEYWEYSDYEYRYICFD